MKYISVKDYFNSIILSSKRKRKIITNYNKCLKKLSVHGKKKFSQRGPEYLLQFNLLKTN